MHLRVCDFENKRRAMDCRTLAIVSRGHADDASHTKLVISHVSDLDFLLPDVLLEFLPTENPSV